MYDLFGKYGAIRQIRTGNAADTKGTAFVIYEDIHDAKQACTHLSGFNVKGRYIIVLYYQKDKTIKKQDAKKELDQLQNLREKYNLKTES